MYKKYFLGVDIGTTAVKTMLVDSNGQELALQRHEHSVYRSQPLWAEEKPEDWWKGFKLTARKVENNSGINLGEISGIGICNLCTSLVVLSSNGEPLYPAIIWNDRRSFEQAESLKNIYKKNNWLSQLGPIDSGEASVTSLLWLIQNKPIAMKNAWKFVHANGYIGYKLTGRATMDASNASKTGLFNKESASWNSSALSALGIDKLVPDYCLSHEIIGGVSRQVANETGLKPGTPVVIGGTDTSCATLGAGVIALGQVLESTGATGVLTSHLTRWIRDDRLNSKCSIIPGLWLTGGGSSGTGLSLQWALDNLGFMESAKIIHSCLDPYKLMDELALQSPVGSNGIIFLPYLGGKRTIIHNPVAKGAFIGLDFSHNKSDLVRSILEGTVFELREVFDTLEEVSVKIREIRSAGGGAKSDVWRQIKSDIFGCPIYTPVVNESASFGAAMLAAIGTGYFKSFEEAVKAWVKLKPKYSEPDRTKHEQYKEYFSLFKEYYNKLFS